MIYLLLLIHIIIDLSAFKPANKSVHAQQVEAESLENYLVMTWDFIEAQTTYLDPYYELLKLITKLGG